MLRVWGVLVLLLLGFCASKPSPKKRLLSPFQSKVPGLNLPNAHFVNAEQNLIRGMEPYEDHHFVALKNLGVTDVLIFKDSKDGSLEGEYGRFVQHGIALKDIHNVPFKWKEIHNFREACEQTLQALRLMRDVERSKGRKLFFHCTVGEDRTGYLTGLYLKLKQPHRAVAEIFQSEMCRHGYEAGNPQKPIERVVLPIRSSLTPLSLKIVYKMDAQRLWLENLNSDECARDPDQEAAYRDYAQKRLPELKCFPQNPVESF